MLSLRPSCLCTKGGQPTLREIITIIITEAGKPVSIPEIVAEMEKRNYRMQSAEPKRALSVKLYTDKTFRVAAPGQFSLRK